MLNFSRFLLLHKVCLGRQNYRGAWGRNRWNIVSNPSLFNSSFRCLSNPLWSPLGFFSEERTYVFLAGIPGGSLPGLYVISCRGIPTLLLTLERWPWGAASKRWYLSYGSNTDFCKALGVGSPLETSPPLLKTLWWFCLFDVIMPSCPLELARYLRGSLANVYVSWTT